MENILKTVKTFTKKTLNIADLKLKKAELEAKKDGLIHDIGEVVYSTYPSVDLDKIKAIMDSIVDVESKEEGVEAAIREQNGKKICPECGAIMDVNMLYCGNCGAKFETPAEDTAETEEAEPEAETSDETK